MKYVICLGDGMSDLPIPECGNKTPLQVATIPNIDFIAQNGQCGLVQTVPEELPPGSDVANMGILGYDPRKYYTGRGPIEAVSLGIDIPPGKIAFRCNVVYIEDEIMKDFSAGHISSEESSKILTELNSKLNTDIVKFFPGVSYRHIVLLDEKYIGLICTPPHDITDKKITEHLPKGSHAQELSDIMHQCAEIMQNSKVNKKRILEGKAPANNIWPWSQGKTPRYPSFESQNHIGGGIVTAVDLLKGIAKLAGLDAPFVEGATGFIDTNYQKKFERALKILEDKDFVYLHIEAPDEMGHIGSVEKKIKAIEDFDKHIVGPMVELQKTRPDIALLVLPDHPTPCKLKTHTRDAVPYAMYIPGIKADSCQKYDEESVKKGNRKIPYSWNLLQTFLQLKNNL
jgi:2,3-bisphosphoglycerate-independent phosphoglycerate mutase